MPMTDLLCHRDAYLKEFEATVVEVDAMECTVAMDRTAFTPGGGQTGLGGAGDGRQH
jgi:Ser-tRNA(Ala) deacylase AlaX